MTKHKDFDAYFAEVEKEDITFTVKGQQFTLPDSLPAIVMIRIMKMQSEEGEGTEVSADVAIEMMEQVFGKETNDRLLETGIGMEEYQEILQWAIGELSGKNKKAAKKTVSK